MALVVVYCDIHKIVHRWAGDHLIGHRRLRLVTGRPGPLIRYTKTEIRGWVSDIKCLFGEPLYGPWSCRCCRGFRRKSSISSGFTIPCSSCVCFFVGLVWNREQYKSRTTRALCGLADKPSTNRARLSYTCWLGCNWKSVHACAISFLRISRSVGGASR